MARGASLSLLGLYQWKEGLFNDMVFPDGWGTPEKEVFINNLLMECAELEIIYPDWDFLKFAIDSWSAKEVITWNRLMIAMLADYNPIENYNRQELMTDTHSGSITHSGTDSARHTGNDSVVGSGTDTDTHSRTSFDNGTLAVTEQMQYGKGSTETHNYNSTVSNTHGQVITDTTQITRSGNIHGNIGVMSNQTMLQQELDIAPKLNVINAMIESFKNRFCILVY